MHVTILQRRVLEPAFLGIIANTVVNALFNNNTYDLNLGKILITLHAPYDTGHTFTISRIKAAAFRKWYNG